MLYRIFYSRMGAAALAAALRYLGQPDRGLFAQLFWSAPGPDRFLLQEPLGEETVLAVAAGREPTVLEHALPALTAAFSPAGRILLQRCPDEPAGLSRQLWLIRHQLVPSRLQADWGERLWGRLQQQGGEGV